MNTARNSGLFGSLSAPMLFIAGLVSIPSFLLQTDLLIKVIQTAIFIVLVLLSKRKIKILPPLIAFLSVLVMNLATPFGRVLYTVFGFTLTEGALIQGCQKALTLVGLVYLSKFSIRKDLLLPGIFGRVVGNTFYYFEHLMEDWSTAGGKGVLNRLDGLLLRLETLRMESGDAVSTPRNLLSDTLFLVIFAGGNWAAFVYNLV